MAVTVNVNDANIFYSPYNWKPNGSTDVETNVTGAYFILPYTGTNLTINLDNTIWGGVNANCPTVIAQIDNGSLTSKTFVNTDTTWVLPTVSAGNHTLRLWVKALNTNTTTRWAASGTRSALRITSFLVDNGAATWAGYTALTNRMVVFTDSHGEGVGADPASATGTLVTNGMMTYGHHLGRAFQAEVGVIGHGGQGYQFAQSQGIPALYLPGSAQSQSWQWYNVGNSRLSGGLFSPAPQYIVVSEGGNDAFNSIATASITASINSMAVDLRTAAPNAWIFFAIPVGRWAKTAHLNATMPDSKCTVLDLGADLATGFTTNTAGDTTAGFGSASWPSDDGLHPKTFTHGLIAARLATLMQSAMGGTASSTGIWVRPVTVGATT